MNETEPLKNDDTSFARYVEIPGHPEFELRLNVGGLPATLSETGMQLSILDQVMKKIEARQKILKQHGINQITSGTELPVQKVAVRKDGKVVKYEERPVGEIKRDGVRYIGYVRSDVEWSKACKVIIDELVPKTKHEDAENVVNGFTHENVIQKLESGVSE